MRQSFKGCKISFASEAIIMKGRYPLTLANIACGGLSLSLYLFALPGNAPPLKILFLLGILLVFLIALLKKKPPGLFMLFFFGAFFLGAWRCHLLPQPSVFSMPFGQTVSISGQIAQPPAIKNTPTGVTVTYLLKDIRLNGNFCPGSIYLSTQEKDSLYFGSGDTIAGKGKLRPVNTLSNFHCPYPLFVLQNDVTGRLFTPEVRCLKKSTAPFDQFKKTLFSFRQRFRAFLARHYGTEISAVIFSLLFGGYENLSIKTIDNFAATGLIHILSVSGSHITLLAGAVIYLGRKIKLPLPLQFALLTICIFIYGALAGFSPPVLRAGLLGLLGFGALILKREANARYLLALVFFSLLSFEPRLLFDIGFELSFAATAGLVYLFAPFCRLLANLYYPIRIILAATLAAQLACLPLLAYYFGSFSLCSFLSCLLAGPILEMLIVIAMLGSVIFVLSPFLAVLPFSLCAALAKITLAEINLLANLPLAQIFVPAFSPVGIAAYLFLLFLLAMPKKRRFLSLFSQKQRLFPYFCLCYLFLLGCFFLSPAKAHVYFFDVGQGDAALIVDSHKKAALIDTGGLRSNENFIAQRVILPQLRRLGIKKISYLFLSHPHADHASAVPQIDQHIPIERIIIGGSPAVYAALWKKELSTPIIKRLHRPKEGEKFLLGEICFTVLDAGEENPKSDQNEASLLLAAQYKGYNLLFTGDLTPQGERRAVKNLGEKLRCDILKIPHHGSGLSSTPEFINACQPRLGVISVGRGNDYKHPAQRVLALLEKKRIQVFRTDECGAVHIELCGKKHRINTCAAAKKITLQAA